MHLIMCLLTFVIVFPEIGLLSSALERIDKYNCTGTPNAYSDVELSGGLAYSTNEAFPPKKLELNWYFIYLSICVSIYLSTNVAWCVWSLYLFTTVAKEYIHDIQTAL